MADKNDKNTHTYSLHVDILWRIFQINADIYWRDREIHIDNETRPLNVLRRTSQVCRKWREIILGSPTLWSRVVELDLLAQNNENWRILVIERCGQSSLCLNGKVSGAHTGSRNFFTNLLDNHWTRIRRFDVYVTDHTQFNEETWRNFLRPATKLEVFKLHLDSNDWDASYVFTNVECPIFANDAPILREFTFPDASTEYMSLQAPWIGQLRSLELAAAFNATELLNSLGNMRSLEYLEVRESISEPEDDPEVHVSLPLLHKLSITNSLKTSLFLLKHITPSPGSSLFLTSEDCTSNDISSQDVADLSQELSRYVRNYFDRNIGFSKSLTFKFGPSKLHFRARDTADEVIPMPPSLNFRIDIFCNGLPENAIPIFLTSLDIRQYCHITRLEFIPYKVEILEDTQLILTTLLSSLPSVTILVIPEYGLQALLKAEQALSIFPSLQTLWFKVVEPTSGLFSKSLLTFLRGRVDTGRPIATLDISDSTKFKERLDWGYLEEFVGLEVVIHWGDADTEGYICGTEVPETLDMRRRL